MGTEMIGVNIATLICNLWPSTKNQSEESYVNYAHFYVTLFPQLMVLFVYLAVGLFAGLQQPEEEGTTTCWEEVTGGNWRMPIVAIQCSLNTFTFRLCSIRNTPVKSETEEDLKSSQPCTSSAPKWLAGWLVDGFWALTKSRGQVLKCHWADSPHLPSCLPPHHTLAAHLLQWDFLCAAIWHKLPPRRKGCYCHGKWPY